MKKLAMVLAVAFTMGLAASTVSASTKDDNSKKAKTECTAEQKKSCASSDKKSCCSSDKKADTTPVAPTKDKK